MQTIPTRMVERRTGELLPIARRDALWEAYQAVEAAQFTDPDHRERYAEILKLARAQRRDDSNRSRAQRLGGRAVLPHDPDYLVAYAHERDALGLQRGRRTFLIRQKTARELWDDELVRAGLRPILDELTVRQRDAVRLVWERGMTRREGGAQLGVTGAKITTRLNRAYERIREAIPERHYRRVRRYLREQGATIGVGGVPATDLPPDGQRPRLSERRAIAIERAESFREEYSRHVCSQMCRHTSRRVATRASSVRLIPVAFASVRYVARLANAVRLAYRVPDREEVA